MFTVAIIGPDGSGKSAVSKLLIDALGDLRFKRVYMGINLETSNVMLPQTWLLLQLKKALGGRPDMAGPFDRSSAKSASKNPLRWLLSRIKGWMLFFIRVPEEWYRQLITKFYLLRGCNVLFDRHFTLDYYYHDMDYQDTTKPLERRVHGYLLKKFYPRPDLVIFLDAPAELLFQRKGEGTIESLEQYRQDYLKLGATLPAFSIVDATQPIALVVEQASICIRSYAGSRAAPRGKPPLAASPSGQTR
jgi:thymidylate kinase